MSLSDSSSQLCLEFGESSKRLLSRQHVGRYDGEAVVGQEGAIIGEATRPDQSG